ncbi:atp synthase subunit a [Leptolyngbya sp. Heron Island J]|uniref:DUF2764 family protein n=1 Tax=Leptolyngbya sp. Heron Island J TaxID=1385935 RepID=UPI0003B94616|nr:DUF2764 family protein [Leptolyngbya sp. Heron Island J]ESA33647.1 atp synthase subunit a [Leptolyngbya sp. Heron Island J]
MFKANQYVTLMASLPYLGELFEAQQTPLSRFKLEARLKMLSEEDAVLLQQIQSLIRWHHVPISRTDAEIVAAAEQFFQQVKNPLLREVVAFRLELHTIVAALRRRQRGEKTAPVGEPWGYGRWVKHIERHWAEPAFRLQGNFPWLLEAQQLLHADESVALERVLFSYVWKRLGQLGAEHYFDFEAVVIYVMRWDLIDRWVRYDGQLAVERFKNLVDAGVGEFDQLFA